MSYIPDYFQNIFLLLDMIAFEVGLLHANYIYEWHESALYVYLSKHYVTIVLLQALEYELTSNVDDVNVS